MNNVTEFSKHFHEKQIGSIEGLNVLIRHSAEFELLTPKNGRLNEDDILGGQIGRALREIGLGVATNEGINNGNGWNADTHPDGYDFTTRSFNQVINNQIYYGTETSTSPLNAIDFNAMKEEMSGYLDIYKQAAGGKYLHNQGGSVHIHNTIAYGDLDGDTDSLVKLDTRKIYRIIATVFARFLPALKYLAMTNKSGPRAMALGNTSYDKLDDDNIFQWANLASRDGYDTNNDTYLYRMGRDSYLRIHRNPDPYSDSYGNSNQFSDRGKGILHWENRILDCTASPTLVASWMSLNRAITLFAFDFARYDYKLELTQNQVFNSKDCLSQFLNGASAINKVFVRSNYKEMMGYLYKYFKKSGCLGAVEVFDKIMEQSIPEYLTEKDLPARYELQLLESMFASRNRATNEELRGRYLRAIKSMLIPVQDNSKAFNIAIASALGIQESQAVNLYQMFKREFDKGISRVDLSFENGRIVDMGD